MRGGGCAVFKVLTVSLILLMTLVASTVELPGAAAAGMRSTGNVVDTDVAAAKAGMAKVSTPPVAAFVARHNRMTVSFDGTGSWSPNGDPITSYSWDFGDGSSDSSSPQVLHTYAQPGRYTVQLRVTDVNGLTGTTTRFVSPADTTVDVLVDQIFEAGCPYKQYWLLRKNTYGNTLLRNQVPCSDYDPWVYFSSSVDLQKVNPSFISTLYRFDAVVRNHPGYSLNDPVVLPVFAPSEAPGPNSYVQLNLSFDFLDSATINYLDSTPFAVNQKYSDGFGYLVRGNITMDLAMSKRIFGVEASTPTDAQSWWRANTGSQPRRPGPLENRYAQWLETLGNVRPGYPGSGTYDIYNAFEWYYEADITWLNATVASDGTTTVRVFWDGWGLDVLMARWWYWGNASYRDAVCVKGDYPECPATLPYGAIQPQGWMPMEACECESATIRGTIRNALDLDFRAVQSYHFKAWANWGTDRTPGTADDLPAWVFAPILMDYVPRQGSGSPAAEGYPNSELRWYEGRTSVHGTPGSYAYGRPYEYINPPTRWPLNAGSTLTILAPRISVTWYDPTKSTWDPMAKIGRYSTFDAPLTLRQICASGSLTACSSAPTGPFYLWDGRGKALSMAGPYDWGSKDLPLDSSPWVEFGPETSKTPVAALDVNRTKLHVDVDASRSSDPSGNISYYRWDWGDGSSPTNLSSPRASHDYANAGLYTITLTVTTVEGLEATASRRVSVAPSTLDYSFYDFFNVSYGEWWDYRTAVYGDHAINAECFNQTSIADGVCKPNNPNVPDSATYPYTNWYPLPGNLIWNSGSNNPMIYAPYRFKVTGANVPGYNLSEPVFLPVFNYGQAPGNRLDFNWYLQYLDKAAGDALTAAGCPNIDPSNFDGFYSRSLINLTMDLQESKRIFGVQANDATSAQAWWRTNADDVCYAESPVETALWNWFQAMGGSSRAIGKYDIANSFEWYYQPYYVQATARVDTDGTTHVSIDTTAWGTEVLLARMFYWGNASYAANYMDSTRAKGWWGMELAWFEGLDFSGALGGSGFDFGLNAAMQYHFKQLSLPGPDGYLNRMGDIPYWTWGPILSDYTNDWSPLHTISELDRYAPVGATYVHSTPGGITYGKSLPYDYAPIRWDLTVGQTWHFQFPTGNIVFYDSNQTPIPSNPVWGYVSISTPVDRLNTVPANYGAWDPVAKTWDVYGPAVTGGPSGSPGNYALEPWGAIQLGPSKGQDQPPVADFSYYPSSPAPGETVYFNASASYDPDGYITDYTWAWGDGSKVSSGTSWNAAHIYSNPGNYTVTLYVTDDGGQVATASRLVIVSGLPPIPRIISVGRPGSITLGQAATIEVQGINLGGLAASGGFVFSFPSNQTNLSVVASDFPPGQMAIIPPGTVVNGCYGTCFVTLAHPMVVGFEYNWASNRTHFMRLSVTPTSPGTFTFNVHMLMFDANNKFYYDPTSGPKSEIGHYVYMYTIQVIESHDVAVTSATASPGKATIGDSVAITVTVENQGGFQETFAVTPYYGDRQAAPAQTVTLAPKQRLTLNFAWDTSGTQPGGYVISARATPVPGEVDLVDNTFNDGRVVLVQKILRVDVACCLDYLLRESVRIRVAALVTDEASGLPVSGAQVTIQVYDEAGNRWAAGTMVEGLSGSGIYEWTTNGTIKDLNVKKGIYMVRVLASYRGGPAYPGLAMVHVDPPADGGPGEGTSVGESYLSVGGVSLAGLALAAGAGLGLGAQRVAKARHRRKGLP